MRELVEAALGREVVGVEPLAGGFQHETSLITLTGGDRVVLRRGGADPVVEAEVMTAARAVARVPAVLHVQPTSMLIEYVEGTVLSTYVDAAAEPAPELHDLGAAVGRTVARLGEVTFDRPGFFAPGLAVVADVPWSQQLPAVAENCMAACPDERLDVATRKAWAALCARRAPELAAVDDQAHLVHADVNPKNILVSHTADGWQVDALLDWEFAYSGCPAGDAANMLRFSADFPAPFVAGFREGFGTGRTGNWEEIGTVLDMFALSDLVTRPPHQPVADRAATRIRQLLRASA